MKFAEIVRKTEKALYDRGFHNHDLRRLLLGQMLLAAAACPVALLSPLVGAWALHFTIGVLLVTVNFYGLAGFAQRAVFVKYDRQLAMGLLFRFYGRLVLTGLALGVLIVWANASTVALLAGLSTIIATILVWGGARFLEHKAKEA